MIHRLWRVLAWFTTVVVIGALTVGMVLVLSPVGWWRRRRDRVLVS